MQLRAYFKQEPLKAITAKRITEYRAWRAEQKVGPATLNAELGILRRILKRARALGACCRRYTPAARAFDDREGLTEARKAAAAQNGCHAARMGDGLPCLRSSA